MLGCALNPTELPPRTRRIPRICVDVFIDWELPPRTRRILSPAAATEPPLGTTSAYAENTEGQVTIDFPDAELPPRTRRIRIVGVECDIQHGTTSAYAENTPRAATAVACRGNYLRVRGEYIWTRPRPWPNMELPPRTRRIPPTRIDSVSAIGTTSAYAENTANIHAALLNHRNYLRVRGEYPPPPPPPPTFGELPPRTRRIPYLIPAPRASQGTTSAYAENTARHTREF